MLPLQTVKMLIMITGSVDTCVPPPSQSVQTHPYGPVVWGSAFGSVETLECPCEEYPRLCLCVQHLQSEQLVVVYSVAANGDGGLERGKLAARIQTPHSVRAEAPRGPGDLSR